MVITIFKQNQDLYDPTNNPFLFNLPPTLSHVTYLFTQTNYPIFLWNSFIIGVIVVAITPMLAVPAWSHVGVFFRVALPLAVPGIGACIVFAFALSLSDYIYAAVSVSATASRTVSAGVPTELIRGDIYYWQALMAATAIVGIPLAIVYGLLFDKLVKGFQSEPAAR